MKNRIIAGAAAAALATVGLLAVAAPASADSYGGEVCTPSAAWTEVVEIPAVGEPTLTVENPDYIPAVEEVSHVVNHPAETGTVHHEAETHTEYHFAKFTRERTRTLGWSGWGAWSDYGAWSKYSPETHTSWELGTNPIGSPQYHSSGSRDWGSVQWERQWQAQYDGQTRTVEDKAAWDETVITKPAWDETVIDVPGKPAVGEPTKTIDNPDYVPASTENVEHEAVTCPTGPRHNANGEATCGAWSITLYNQQDEGYEARTASFVVYIDGEFDEAYAVAGGEQETISGTFPEDSGNHRVIVRTGAAQGDEFVFSLDVTSDCIVAQPEPEIVTEQATPEIPCDAEVGDEIATTATVTTTPYVLNDGAWVPGEPVVTTEDSAYVVTEADVAALEECPVIPTEPTEPTAPTTPVVTPTTPLTPAVTTPVKAAAASDDTLAQTGGTVDHGILGFASLLLIAGLGVLGFRRFARR